MQSRWHMTELVLPNMADEILSDQELAEITGCAYKSAQAEWLTDAGWVFHKNKAGRTGSVFLIADANGQPYKLRTFRTHFDTARAAALKEHPKMKDSIEALWFSDARSKAASDMDGQHAQALLGHTEQKVTETVYRRRGATVMPTR